MAKQRAQDLICQCIQGKAPKDVIDELAAELPDLNQVKSDLLRDLGREGIVLPKESVKISDSSLLIETETASYNVFRMVLSVYERVYPDVEFLISTP